MSRTSCVLILLTLATYSSVADCEQNANATATSRAGRQLDIPRDLRVVRIFLDQQQHLRRPPQQISSRSDHFPQRVSYGPGAGPYGRPPFGRPKPQQPLPHLRRRVHNGPPGPPPPGVFLHPNGPPQYNNYQMYKNTRYPVAKGPYVQKGAPVNYYGQSQNNVAPNLNVIPQGHNFKPSPIYNGEVIVRHPSAAPLVGAPPSLPPPQQSQQSEEKQIQQLLRPYKPQSSPPVVDPEHAMYSVYEDNDSELENSYPHANIGEHAMQEAKQYLNFMSSNEYFLPKIEPDYRKLDQAKQQHHQQQQSETAALTAFQQQQQQQLQQQQQRNSESSSLNAAFTVNAPLRVSASSSSPQAQAQSGNSISPTSSYPNRHPGSYQADSNVFVVNSDGIKNVHHIVSTSSSSYPEGNQQSQHNIPTFSSGLRPMLKERLPDPERVEFTERDAIHVSYTSNPMDSVSRYSEKQHHQQQQQQQQQQSQTDRRYVQPTSATIQQQEQEDDEEMMQAASIPTEPKPKKKKYYKEEHLYHYQKTVSDQESFDVDNPALDDQQMDARAARVQISAESLAPTAPDSVQPPKVIETSTVLPSTTAPVPVCSDGSGKDCGTEDTTIERETARLRAREELLRLRQSVDQLVRDQGVTPPPPPNKIDFTDVEGSIAPFTGDDDYSVQKWIADFEDIMESIHASDADKYRCARRLMKDTAKIFLRTIRVTTWDELKQALFKRFERQLSQFEIYERLRKRFKKRDETIDKYIIIMTELAQHGDVREIDLVQMIIAGLQDTSAHISILAGATTIDELLDRVKVYQSAIAAAEGAAAYMRSPPIAPPSRTISFLVHHTTKTSPWPVEQSRCTNCSPPHEPVRKNCSRQKLAFGTCINCVDGNHHHRDCTPSKRKKFITPAVPDVTTNGYEATTGVTEEWPETTTTGRRDIYGRVKVNPNETPSNPSVEQKDTEEYCERICSNVQDEDEEVVCGSDGFMYTSEAQMECYASCLHIDVTIQSKGTCNQSL